MRLSYINEDRIKLQFDDIAYTFESVGKLIKNDGFVAYRTYKYHSNKKSLEWVVLYNNDPIGYICKNDKRWVHDNWTARIIFNGDKPLHKLITKDTRPIVQDELNKLARKVSKAYHDGDSDIVQ